MTRKNNLIGKRILLLTIPLLAFLASGCTTRIGEFSIVSTGTPQYTEMDKTPETKHATGKDGRFWFLFIPLDGSPKLEEAVDRCMDKGNGDYIERVRLYRKQWTLLLFSYGSYSAVGEVGNSKN